MLQLFPAITLAEIDVLSVVLIVLALLGGVGAGVGLCKVLIGKTLGQARAEAKQIQARAEADAATAAEKIVLEAEREALERKEKAEKEFETERGELRETERRLAKREDAFDRKEESLAERERQLQSQSDRLRQKEEKFATREEALGKREEEIERLIAQQRERLLEVSGLSVEQATERLLRRVEEEKRHDVAKLVRKIEEEAEAKAKERAREVTLMAIQRYASDITSESTVRTVEIPSDDMKGRIIGREGRNIRAIEKATGVDIIVDDTPGVIVVSCFDKVRQQVAVEALQRLVADGRMHPARIEEVVEKVRAEMDERIQKFGKDAILEVNLRGVHPKIAEAMGKLHYRTSFGQNVLRHSIEVAYLCQIIAEQIGLDGRLARRCGFLHDIGKAMDHEMEGGHPKIGMDFAKQYGEKEPVLNAIGGHHADIPSTSFYTPIVMAADAVSSARPGARRESMERYVQRLTELQDIAMSMPGVTEAYAIQAGREVRVMVDAARVGDDEAYLIAHDIARRVSEEMTFPGEIRVTVLRETRAIEVAR
ncbi:MAG: ribonuclease Y [Phycisphaeraceae bacterium]|nr:ribonuclease Y [Phycisphaeraceae bacterium]MCW5753575.1 ribonuclease Y [Phycisphaeraceae bacterium]